MSPASSKARVVGLSNFKVAARGSDRVGDATGTLGVSIKLVLKLEWCVDLRTYLNELQYSSRASTQLKVDSVQRMESVILITTSRQLPVGGSDTDDSIIHHLAHEWHVE